jgi:uncharacterized delta-60 repeat protein
MMLQKVLTRIFLLVLLVTPVAVLAQDYATDETFYPALTGRTHQFFDHTNVVAIQPDQKILVGGNFTAVDGVACPLITRLNANGTRDTSFNSPLGFQTNDEVVMIKVMPDGKILISGTFRISGNLVRFVRLNADGTVDGSFSAAFLGNIVRAVKLYPDGRILECGGVYTDGSDSLTIARLQPNGSLDTTFRAHVTGDNCSDIELAPDGGIYAAGITISDGFSVSGLIKLTPDGTVDPSFVRPNGGSSIRHFRLALQPDGKLIAARKVTTTDGQGELVVSWNLVRYSATGQTQVLNACGRAEAGTFLYLQNDGKIITNDCAIQNPAIHVTFARVFPDGAVDTALAPITFNGNTISGAQRQADGSYVVVGNFGTVNSIPHARIVRLVSTAPPARHQFDFDGDGKDDIGVFRPSDHFWYINRSTSGFGYVQWGLPTDKLVAADYDNDGKTDVAVFRDGVWYTLVSSTNTLLVQTFGQAGDQPFVGDLNGDGLIDLVVRHQLPNTSIEWQIRYQGASGTSATQTIAGENNAFPGVIADFSGDNIDEVAYFKNGDWYSRQVGAAPPILYHFGSPGDIPAAGDYDHDGQTDYAVFRPSTGDWYLNLTTTGFLALHFGASGDIPVPADYDGDGRIDIAVFRNGAWYQIRSGDGTFRGEMWGLAGDAPIPAQAR